MPAKKPAKKMPPPRVPVLAEEKLTPAQRALLELDPLRPARRQHDHPRAVRGVPACSGLRRAGAATRRPLPLQDGGAAAALRVRHPGHRQAVARAIRMVRPRAAGRARGRQDRRRSAICTRGACRNRPRRTSARSTTSSRSSTRRGASAIRPSSACSAILGEAATVEFVGILGYYVLISMILNVFRMSPPAGEPLPFAET